MYAERTATSYGLDTLVSASRHGHVSGLENLIIDATLSLQSQRLIISDDHAAGLEQATA